MIKLSCSQQLSPPLALGAVSLWHPEDAQCWELSLSDTLRMLSVGWMCTIDMLQLIMLGFDSYSLVLRRCFSSRLVHSILKGSAQKGLLSEYPLPQLQHHLCGKPSWTLPTEAVSSYPDTSCARCPSLDWGSWKRDWCLCPQEPRYVWRMVGTQ